MISFFRDIEHLDEPLTLIKDRWTDTPTSPQKYDSSQITI